jgi:DNA-binding transcriptional MerR regulator
MDHTDTTLLSLREELELARAEQAEALRRALHLRSRGASYSEIQAAMREVDSHQANVARLQLEVRRQQLP